MTGWVLFLAALVTFLLSHAIPVRPAVRGWLIGTLGHRGYFTGYSILSLAVLAWLIVAAANAPYVEVIPPFAVLRWVPVLIMPVVCWLALAGIIIQNPFSFGGLGDRPFDPEQPGILRTTRHPILAALMLWALAHLLANGSLSHVILFGLFAGFAAMGMALIDRRKHSEMGMEWIRLSRNTARFSLRAPRPWPRPWVWLSALAAYAVLLHLHAPVIGLSPLP
ncbi:MULTISPECIES: NnrU family protein [unclassified Ruegeria]|uniref:NnrU family protein n=1 Tax=unclassified Ruegeria TaxID=2625375 RepID=UPI0014887A24|nr:MULTISPECIES: NnrU family protein [unclassified Ruegeria]NOD74703.1 NnrU family protein [Ruegeria sp. HKCCD4332]NOD88563.1 NnrU family protein [Ruegeria sp. HKCCD4318]NOE12209.1 NnrU family protein [Ruegeria sp. HKCCD4318-2]NOG09626.1 NnrU family protein [Ruegeria sp. HKCCD4315]